jgi:glycosyltransferase involved in cell wall biosynthesis
MTESATKLRAELGLQDAFIVLYIGAHGISQGLTALLKAADRLRTEPQVQSLFVGEGADKEKLVVEAARIGLKNVRFIEPVKKAKVREYYSMADVCLVPLRNIPLFDTFIPSKMFEIMSVGRPIVASLRGEAAQILRQSGGAAVVPPEDDAALAAAVLELCRDPARRAAMGAHGHDFTRSNYSRATLAQRYERVMEDAVASFGKEKR